MFGNPQPSLISMNQACTRTYIVNTPSKALLERYNFDQLIAQLEQFNLLTYGLRMVDRHTLYRSFKIPKKKGGFRQIDAPNDLLMGFLRTLKSILENDFGALYHTSAFAYIKGRCTLDSIKRHQKNSSRWFAKYDFSNFFGSTTKGFVMQMLSMIFPFSEVMKTERGRTALDNALDLAFLDGVLPQGTPISPLLTNLMMIPVDHALYNKFRDFDKSQFVYTRYADDILVSSKYNFDFRKIESEINYVLHGFRAPFKIKKEKTRYGSSAGSNWNLGVMLNKDNNITIGSKKKRQFAAMITNYILDSLHGKPWPKNDIMVLDGYRNYYMMVEPERINQIITRISRKFGVNVNKMLKNDLRC